MTSPFRPLQSFVGHSEGITCICVFEELILSGSHDKTIRKWNLSGKALQVLKGHEDTVEDIVVHRGNIVSASRDRTIRIWSDDKETAKLQGHLDWVTCLSSMGAILFSGSYDRSIKAWNVDRSECLMSIRASGAGFCLQSIDNVIVATAGNDLVIWDFPKGVSIARGHKDYISALAVGKERIFTGSYDTSIRVWNLKGFVCVLLNGHGGIIWALKLKEDLLFSASGDHSVKVWNWRSASCLRTILCHQKSVTALHLLPEEGLFLTGSADCSLALFPSPVASLKYLCLQYLQHHPSLRSKCRLPEELQMFFTEIKCN